MDILVIIVVVVLSLVILGSATQVKRVDAPVNPPGRVRIRRNYQFWWLSFKGVAGPIFWFVLGLVLGLHWPR
jgi:hypothetical protein